MGGFTRCFSHRPRPQGLFLSKAPRVWLPCRHLAAEEEAGQHTSLCGVIARVTTDGKTQAPVLVLEDPGAGGGSRRPGRRWLFWKTRVPVLVLEDPSRWWPGPQLARTRSAASVSCRKLLRGAGPEGHGVLGDTSQQGEKTPLTQLPTSFKVRPVSPGGLRSRKQIHVGKGFVTSD